MEQTFTREQVDNGELKNLFDYLLGFNSNTVGKTFMDITAETNGDYTIVKWEEVAYDRPGAVIKDVNALQALSMALQNLPLTDCIVVGDGMVPMLKSCPDFDYDENSRPGEGRAVVIGRWNQNSISYKVCYKDDVEGEIWFLRKGGYMLFKIDLGGRI